MQAAMYVHTYQCAQTCEHNTAREKSNPEMRFFLDAADRRKYDGQSKVMFPAHKTNAPSGPQWGRGQEMEG